MANQYEVKFRIKGVSGNQSTIVTANDPSKAKKLVEAQYNGSKVSFLSTKRL